MQRWRTGWRVAVAVSVFFGSQLAVTSEPPPDPEEEEVSPDPVDPKPQIEPPPELPEGILPDVGELPPSAEDVGLADLPPWEEAGANGLLDDPTLFPGEPDAFEDLDIERGDEEGAAGGAGADFFGAPGFDTVVAMTEFLPGGFRGPLNRQGVRFALGVQLGYDSNILLDEEDEVGDFTLTVSPTIEWRSAPDGVPGQVNVHYTPHFRYYLDESDLNGIDHSAGATVSYAGVRGQVSAAVNYGRFMRPDRLVGGLVETSSFSGSGSVAYQVGARTSVEASLRGSTTEDQDRQRSTAVGGSSDTTTMTAQVSGYWQATAKSRFGPSVRYSRNSAGLAGDRASVALLLVGDYAPREGLSFNASAGLERVESEQFGEDGDIDFTGSFGVVYQPNNRFGVQADLRYESIPQGNLQATRTGGGSQNFNGNVSLRYTPNPQWAFAVTAAADSFPAADLAATSVADQTYTATITRNLTRASISLDGSLSYSSYDALGSGAAAREDGETQSVALRYNRAIFAERASLNASLRWSQSSGDFDWERFQAALGVNVEF